MSLWPLLAYYSDWQFRHYLSPCLKRRFGDWNIYITVHRWKPTQLVRVDKANPYLCSFSGPEIATRSLRLAQRVSFYLRLEMQSSFCNIVLSKRRPMDSIQEVVLTCRRYQFSDLVYVKGRFISHLSPKIHSLLRGIFLAKFTTFSWLPPFLHYYKCSYLFCDVSGRHSGWCLFLVT